MLTSRYDSILVCLGNSPMACSESLIDDVGCYKSLPRQTRKRANGGTGHAANRTYRLTDFLKILKSKGKTHNGKEAATTKT